MINEENLPENWKLIELKDVCHNKGEYGSGAKAINFDPDLPRYLRITDIDLNGFLNFKKVSPSIIEDKYFLKEGDLLFARSGATVGKTYLYNDSDGICQYAGYLIRFEPNFDLIDPDYLFFYVKSPYYWLWVASKQKTMTLPNVNAKMYSKMPIPLPSMQTQKKIVDILSNAEKLRQSRAEANKFTNEYLKSVFVKMFGDPVRNDRKWAISLLEDESHKITDGEHNTPVLSNSGIPYISAKNVKEKITFNDCKYVDEVNYEKIIRRCKPELNDIMVTCVGTIGRIKRIDIDKKFTFARSIALIKPNKNVLNPIFLEKMLSLPNMNKYMTNETNEATVKGLYLKQIKKLKIPVPPLKLQNQFAEIVTNVETIKNHQNKSKQEIDNLINTLMQKAFKGELVC